MAGNVTQLFKEFSDTHNFLAGMTAAQKERLATIASVKKFVNRQTIATPSAAVDGIYFIIRGSVRLENIGENGERFLSGDLMAGDVFGLLSVLDGKNPNHYASWNGESTAIFVPAGQFRDFIFSDLELTKAMLQLMCQRVRMSLISFNRFAPGNLTARVVRCLLTYIDQLDPEHMGRAQVAINQYDIAAMLSVSRQSVHKVLKELEASGVLTIGYNFVDIRDLPRLRHLQ